MNRTFLFLICLFKFTEIFPWQIYPSKRALITLVSLNTNASYGFKKALNEPDVSSLLDTNPRECQTVHSSELNKVFFSTLDEFDCYVDPFSILR